MPETAATMRIRNPRSEIRKLLDLLQLTFISSRVIRCDSHIERERLVTRRAHFDAVRAGIKMQALEDAVEIVDDADVVAVDVHLAFLRLDLQAQRPFVAVGV